MQVLIAPDKFKGTLTARAAAQAMAAGWRSVRPRDGLTLLPTSDGGDGFGEILSELLGCEERQAAGVDAAHRAITAPCWWQSASRTAVVESARVIGLAQLPPGRYHPFQLDTQGLGLVLKQAAEWGAQKCLVGIGGSATNDGGFGLARGLGWRFLDVAGKEIERWTELPRLHSVVPPEVRQPFAELTVAVDVQNPLLGPEGCSRIYGPQKGLRPEDFAVAEASLSRLAEVMAGSPGAAIAQEPGVGAAGGLGFGLRVFAGGRLAPGFGLYAAHAKLREHLQEAQLVITGEGAIDASSLMGKGVGEVARLCQELNVPCIGLGGQVADSARNHPLFASVLALAPDLTDTAQAQSRAAFWLEQSAARAARDWTERHPGET